MNSEPNQSADQQAGLPISSHSQPPPDVPVFNCVVYIAPHDEGGVQARVGNLAGFSVRAASEREALGVIVKSFKQHVKELTENGEEIDWIEPPEPPTPQEQTRYIPVHL